jgi:hypothetical protein
MHRKIEKIARLFMGKYEISTHVISLGARNRICPKSGGGVDIVNISVLN